MGLGSLFFKPTPFRSYEDMLNGFMTFGSSASGESEKIEDDFLSRVQQAYKASGPIFACILARAKPFSEARFQFQEMVDGRPGRLTGGPALAILDTPWTNATTGELLWRMEQDASLAGNFYATTVGNRIKRMRPDWVTIVSGVRGDTEGSPFDLAAEVLGYIYAPSGVANPPDPVLLTPESVVHYSPIPDPEAQWRGMSWISPLVDEIMADKNATRHKLKYFENGTTSNLVVTYEGNKTIEQVRVFRDLFDESHRGTDNAYKVIHLGGGADAKTLGANLQQLEFKATQGAGETRIAAAAGVGAIIAGFSEGLQGSSLNAGNYSAAKRQFADMTLRPLWRTATAALAKLVTIPAGSRLWFDVRDIEFLKDDRRDAADVQAITATTIASLIMAGFRPDDVIDAVDADDLTRLIKKHSGLYSVQLRPSGDTAEITLAQQVEAAGALVRAGYDPAGALVAVGLDPIQHLGLLPVTLQAPRQLALPV